MFRLDENLIGEFKAPLGKLYPEFEDAISLIKEANFLISVGDQTTKNLVDIDLIPDLGIIDHRIQRKDHNYDIIRTENILEADNPAGTITENLWETIEEAISLTLKDSEKRIIVVEGEEDLAVLPCLLIAPEDAVILYGQPNEGLVFVNVCEGKDKAERLMTFFNEE
ncbi:MAG: GTP-dependent dephospho-CoA kinase family protein [Methanobrevibacter sp.]|nr:GTP-dependent dephospho-CoA kinase family protein [Methanobrevibacter sp.]MBO6105800.1 GTP-dependent dephospho-CoA kinase family protein [Methanobrevibacter sp.]MBO7159295.1 GTP-dependent dephospho-CoA kinase family protein [Methanobrevibacter sp.]MBO7209867.1 GTP-dependent dephospho-CoA kinase family protein [Methanobrevibacter sp.]MBO7241399.1 GTP-dependent dephospho-CoA kinase family protein [Methanobrevibacter sp.]